MLLFKTPCLGTEPKILSMLGKQALNFDFHPAFSFYFELGSQ